MSATPISGPYTHEKSSISRTMIWVMVALTPATAWGIYQFGLPALFLFIITIAACLISEAVCLYIAGKPIKPFLADGSAIAGHDPAALGALVDRCSRCIAGHRGG